MTFLNATKPEISFKAGRIMNACKMNLASFLCEMVSNVAGNFKTVCPNCFKYNTVNARKNRVFKLTTGCPKDTQKPLCLTPWTCWRSISFLHNNTTQMYAYMAKKQFWQQVIVQYIQLISSFLICWMAFIRLNISFCSRHALYIIGRLFEYKQYSLVPHLKQH